MQIETERLILREFREDDWRDMAAYWADPQYQRFYPEQEDIEQSVRGLASSFLSAQSAEPRRKWQLAITVRSCDRLIGICAIRVSDPANRTANIGYELDPRHWGQGYATEAASAIVRFGFEELALHRIWAEVISDNTGSIHVLEKLGMRREAHFREYRFYRDRWWDTLVYAILDHEWRAMQDG